MCHGALDRLSAGVVREIVEARRAGATVRDVAERWGISESSVKRIARTQI
jgi:Homeodomain-like domain